MPAYQAAQRENWRRLLSQHLGAEVTVGGVSHPKYGVTLLEELEIRDQESGSPVAKAWPHCSCLGYPMTCIRVCKLLPACWQVATLTDKLAVFFEKSWGEYFVITSYLYMLIAFNYSLYPHVIFINPG